MKKLIYLLLLLPMLANAQEDTTAVGQLPVGSNSASNIAYRYKLVGGKLVPYIYFPALGKYWWIPTTQFINQNFQQIPDGLQSVTSITQSGNVVTVTNPVWRINKVQYSKPGSTNLTIASATTGYKRIDIIVGNTSNNLQVVQGIQDQNTAVEPNIPANTVRIAPVYVNGNSVTPPQPDLSSYALDAKVLHNTGNENKKGNLNFVNGSVLSFSRNTDYMRLWVDSVASNKSLFRFDFGDDDTEGAAVADTVVFGGISSGGSRRRWLTLNGEVLKYLTYDIWHAGNFNPSNYALDANALHKTGNETKTGNLGVYVTTPKTSLHIGNSTELMAIPALGTWGGTLGISNNPAGLYGLNISPLSNGNVYLQVGRNDANATAYNLLLQPKGGSIGIGTETPTEKVHIVGNALADGYKISGRSDADIVTAGGGFFSKSTLGQLALGNTWAQSQNVSYTPSGTTDAPGFYALNSSGTSFKSGFTMGAGTGTNRTSWIHDIRATGVNDVSLYHLTNNRVSIHVDENLNVEFPNNIAAGFTTLQARLTMPLGTTAYGQTLWPVSPAPTTPVANTVQNLSGRMGFWSNSTTFNQFAYVSEVGSAIDNIQGVSVNKTISASDFAAGKKTTLDLYVDATAGSVTVTLPNSSTFQGYTIYVTKTDNSANVVTINTVTGANTLTNKDQVRQFKSDGTVWRNH